jgi:uncharacterized membrane protein
LVWLAGLRPLWLDEVLTLAGAVKPTVHELLVWVGFNPGSSPLGFLIERPFIETMGLTRLGARLPSILFSILSAIALAGFARDLKLPGGSSLLLIMYLALPIQLRYAVEARPYTAALFFTIAALWCLWRLLEGPKAPERSSWGLAIAYALLVAAALYAQPFAAFVQIGALAALALSSQRRAVVVAAVALAAGCLLFAPWYLHVSEAWRQEIAGSGYTTTFTPRSLLIFVREIAGGGYWQSIPLLLAACLGWRELQPRVRQFLLGAILLGAGGAMAADATSGYFFATRHALFVIPALVVLATAGFTASRSGRYRWLGCALAAVLIPASIVKSWGYFRSGSEDWPGAARALLAEARTGVCVIVMQPEPEDLYAIFEPELRGHFCTPASASGPVVIVTTRYTVAERVAQTVTVLTARGFRTNGTTVLPSGVALLLFR